METIDECATSLTDDVFLKVCNSAKQMRVRREMIYSYSALRADRDFRAFCRTELKEIDASAKRLTGMILCVHVLFPFIRDNVAMPRVLQTR